MGGEWVLLSDSSICTAQAWLSSQLRIIHVVADEAELATLLRRYAARQHPDGSAGRARSPAIAKEGPDGIWQRVREVGAGGAILVRPDGHVGWRCSSRLMREGHADEANLTSLSKVLSASVKRILCC